VQALRKLGEDQYAVFVVQPDGTLEMRAVEVGLMDYVNAEIRSGLQQGEVVSIGEKTNTSSGQATPSTTQPQSPGGDMIPPFMGG
jgi:macrolide-specific efflux system membrane fusion protein